MKFVPNGRNGQLEMRVVGEQRFPRSRVRAADHPIVAPKSVANFCGHFCDEVRGGSFGRSDAVPRVQRGRKIHELRRDARAARTRSSFQHRVRFHVIVIVTVVTVIGLFVRAFGAIVRYIRIADDEVIHRGLLREEVLATVRAHPLQHFRARQLFFPSVRQRLVHIAGDGQCVGGRPGPRLVFQQGKFQRQAVSVLFDKAIDAARVGFHDVARFRVHLREVAFGGAAEAKGAKLLVDGHGIFAEHFGELSARHAAQQVHLPQAILRHHIAFGFHQVLHAGGANVRHAPAVALHGDGLFQAADVRGAIDLRQRAIHVPPKHAARGQDDDGQQPAENTQRFQQKHSHAGFLQSGARKIPV